MNKPSERFPCLDAKTNNYRGCTGMRCPHFDPYRPIPGCLFYVTRKEDRIPVEKVRKGA